MNPNFTYSKTSNSHHPASNFPFFKKNLPVQKKWLPSSQTLGVPVKKQAENYPLNLIRIIPA